MKRKVWIKIPMWLIVVLLLTVVFPANQAWAERMTLEQCLNEVVSNYSQLKAANAEVEKQLGERNSIRGRFLPMVRAEANLLYWGDEFTSDMLGDFMGPLGAVFEEMGPFLSADTQAQLQPLLTADTSMVLREQLTYGAKVTVAQPLTQLYQIYSGYWANDELTDAARYNRDTKRQDIEGTVSKAYYSLISATRMLETVKSAYKQVEAYEKQVEAYMEAELVERNALLKVQVQKAEIQKNIFQVEKGIQLAKAALNMYMGRSFDSPLIPVYEEQVGTQLLNDSLQAQKSTAVQTHPMLKAIQHQKEAAKAGKHAAIAAMLPELNAVFQYEYAGGLGDMSQKHAYFGGLVLSWDIWEWGADFYKAKSAYAQHDIATYGLQAATDGVRLQVEQKRLDLKEALQEVEVASAQLKQAKESLRIEEVRYEVQEATTTDLLGTQTQAIKAENDLIVAEMNVKIAETALMLSMGNDLLN